MSDARASARLQLEYEIKKEAQMLRPIAEVVAASAGTDPLTLLRFCDELSTKAAIIESYARQIKSILGVSYAQE